MNSNDPPDEQWKWLQQLRDAAAEKIDEPPPDWSNPESRRSFLHEAKQALDAFDGTRCLPEETHADVATWPEDISRLEQEHQAALETYDHIIASAQSLTRQGNDALKVLKARLEEVSLREEQDKVFTGNGSSSKEAAESSTWPHRASMEPIDAASDDQSNFGDFQFADNELESDHNLGQSSPAMRLSDKSRGKQAVYDDLRGGTPVYTHAAPADTERDLQRGRQPSPVVERHEILWRGAGTGTQPWLPAGAEDPLPANADVGRQPDPASARLALDHAETLPNGDATADADVNAAEDSDESEPKSAPKKKIPALPMVVRDRKDTQWVALDGLSPDARDVLVKDNRGMATRTKSAHLYSRMVSKGVSECCMQCEIISHRPAECPLEDKNTACGKCINAKWPCSRLIEHNGAMTAAYLPRGGDSDWSTLDHWAQGTAKKRKHQT